MASHRGRARSVALDEDATEERARPHARRPRLTRRVALLISLGILLAVTLGGVGFYVAGPLNPLARVGTVAELPALPAPAVYTSAAVDGAGWVWVGQSAAGTRAAPHDLTTLTVIDPATLIGDPVRARLCVGCAGMVSATAAPLPTLARVDALAADPAVPHTMYVGGWTAAQGANAASPVIVHINLAPGATTCAANARCGVATDILDLATPIATAAGAPLKDALATAIAGGATPNLTLATAPNGDLFVALSDRGATSLSVPSTNVVGGLEMVLRYTARTKQWTLVGSFPAGFPAAQRLGALATVTALAVDRAERALYLADADHHAIFRLDLGSAALAQAKPLALTAPFLTEAALRRVAGADLTATPPGADAEQAVTGDAGDGGPALAARLGTVRGLVFDAAGDLLVADATSGRVRLITPGGTIWTVAGRGAAVVDGDGGPPLAAGLGGVTALARGAGGRFYALQGALIDGSGRARLRSLQWGWSAPGQRVARATTPGQGILPVALAGLPEQGRRVTVAEVVSDGACAAATPGLCVTPYLATASDGAPWMADLAAAGPYVTASGQGAYSLPAGQPANLSNNPPADLSNNPPAGAPLVGLSVVGAPFAVAATATELVTLAPYAGCCAVGDAATSGVALPAGASVTGLAALVPTTDTQVGALGGSAFILVATTGLAGGPALLIYRAAAESCGLSAPQASACARFPGTPTLAAMVALAPESAAGSVAAALSDDGHHAFALVSDPAADHVSVIDLAAFLATGATPTVTARVVAPSPGPISIRHDGLAAYIGASDGQVATLATAGWLATGVPATLSADALPLTRVGATTTITTGLALSADDARLFVLTRAANGAATITAADVGQFGQVGALTALGSAPTDGQPLALALTPDDTRLLTLSAPGGANQRGIVRTFATRDPAAPLNWLATPLNLGATATPPQSRLLLMAQP